MNSREELPQLFEDHRQTSIGVEVGVQNGLFSVCILKKWQGTLKCVDIWDDEEVYKKAKENLGEERMIRKTSVEAAKEFADGSLDFVYIDAAHDYESVKEDLEAWYPKVRAGGVVSGHDYVAHQDFGVIEAVNTFAEEHDYTVELTDNDYWKGVNFSSWYFIKKGTPVTTKIPKIIYTTWVSDKPMPTKFQQFIDTWKTVMPDYEIRVITLENCPRNAWVNEAIRHNKYVLAGHWGRVQRLHETGGIYFDLDVEVVKRFDDFLNDSYFVGVEKDNYINNAVMGSVAGHQFLKDQMDYMLKVSHDADPVETGPRMLTDILKKYGWEPKNENTEIKDIKIYGKEYFYPYDYDQEFSPECVTENTHAIHRWAHSWRKSDLVSVVIPCYKQAHFLDECIQSVLKQTYLNIEIIVVNDGSPDNTTEVALKYPVTLVVKKNGGLSSARNAGIKLAKGEYIVCLDSDDTIDPTYVEKCVAQQGDITCTAMEEFGDGRGSHQPDKERLTLQDFIRANRIFCSAMFKRRVWELVGGYDEKLVRAYEDWDMWIRALQAGFTIKIVPEFLFNYRIHKDSMCRKNVDGHQEELYKDVIWSKYKHLIV